MLCLARQLQVVLKQGVGGSSCWFCSLILSRTASVFNSIYLAYLKVAVSVLGLDRICCHHASTVLPGAEELVAILQADPVQLRLLYQLREVWAEGWSLAELEAD